MLFYCIAIMVIAVDQLAKIAVRGSIEVGSTVTLWESFLNLTHYENSGMAHSLFQGYGRLFAVFAVIFIAGVLYYRQKGEIKGKPMDISMGFLVGGAAGNAIDRILFGKVTDFLEFTSGHGILNLADVAINIGVVLLLITAAVSIILRKPVS
ncbi:signal peptidase II [Paenibacillus vulneris]|uniref:Lipoprotein signal peptidase n=1 Tax=Paenibacillus vulneris TaxID=1133364 RepID=A0ABW3UL63_9BACL|nr:signal peptidase II [Paenibacillus sp. OAS669]MBE1441588.1 signal peptidase II [Paenibacillus sp. OAS669]